MTEAGFFFRSASLPLATTSPPSLACAWPEVNDVVGFADRFLIMFHNENGVSSVLEFLQGVKKDPVVPGVETDGRLIQDVGDAREIGAELRGQTDTLSLLLLKGCRRFGSEKGRIGRGGSTKARRIRISAMAGPAMGASWGENENPFRVS